MNRRTYRSRFSIILRVSRYFFKFNLVQFIVKLHRGRGVYPPWVEEANTPPEPTPDGSRGGSWHGTWYMYVCISICSSKLSRFVGGGSDESPDNYWGCKNWRRRPKRCGKFEQYEIYHYSPRAQTMQWLKQGRLHRGEWKQLLPTWVRGDKIPPQAPWIPPELKNKIVWEKK